MISYSFNKLKYPVNDIFQLRRGDVPDSVLKAWMIWMSNVSDIPIDVDFMPTDPGMIAHSMVILHAVNMVEGRTDTELDTAIVIVKRLYEVQLQNSVLDYEDQSEISISDLDSGFGILNGNPVPKS